MITSIYYLELLVGDDMNQQENAVREKRKIEATKKNLMGPSGKLGMIAKFLGSDIIGQGSDLLDLHYMDHFNDDFVEKEYAPTVSDQKGPVSWRDEIKDMEDGISTSALGYIFDGLSRGMHLEIKYFKENGELVANYKGYEVYHEIAGELNGYAPFPEWEDMITRLHKSAKQKREKIKQQQKKEIGEKIESQKAGIWQKLRLRWGL